MLITDIPSVSVYRPQPLTTHFGNVFYVDSARGSDASRTGHKHAPFATLDYAIGRCTADNGDVIVVKENHAETITGAGGITADVAGITILGCGHYNQRPRFLMDGGTTVTFLVSAADVTIRNCVFASGHADVVTCFNVTGVGCWIDACEFVDNTSNEDWLVCIKATGADNTADGLRVTNCRWLTAMTSATEFIEITSNLKGLEVTGNLCITASAAFALVQSLTTKIITGAVIAWNFIDGEGATGTDQLIDNGGATNSGVVAHNRVAHADVTGVMEMGAATGLRFFDNLGVSTEVLQGVLAPDVDVNL